MPWIMICDILHYLCTVTVEVFYIYLALVCIFHVVCRLKLDLILQILGTEALILLICQCHLCKLWDLQSEVMLKEEFKPTLIKYFK